MPVFVRDNNHLKHPSEQARFSLQLDIKRRSQEERQCRQKHEHDRNSETNFPTNFILKVHNASHGNKNGKCGGNIVPAEVDFQGTGIFMAVVFFQLVGTEG